MAKMPLDDRAWKSAARGVFQISAVACGIAAIAISVVNHEEFHVLWLVVALPMVAYSTYFLSIAIHELAHLVAGWLTGQRLYSLHIGPLGIYRAGRRFVFTLGQTDPLSGHCGMGLRPITGVFVREFLSIVVAPLASIAFAFGVFYFFASQSDPGGPSQQIISMAAFLPACLGAATTFLMPQESDIAHVRSLFKRAQLAKVDSATKYLYWETCCGVRPKNLSPVHLEVIRHVPAESEPSMSTEWMLWQHAFDDGNIEAMADVTERHRMTAVMLLESDQDSLDDALRWQMFVLILDGQLAVLRDRNADMGEYVVDQFDLWNEGDDYVDYWIEALRLAVFAIRQDNRRYEVASSLYHDLTSAPFTRYDEDYVRDHITRWVPDFDFSAADER